VGTGPVILLDIPPATAWPDRTARPDRPPDVTCRRAPASTRWTLRGWSEN